MNSVNICCCTGLEAKESVAPLHRAVIYDSVESVIHLIENGADINVVSTCMKNTPLHFSVEMNQLEIAQILVSRGANPDTDDVRGDSPLHKAVFQDNIRMIGILLAAGADIDIRNGDGCTPLHLAIRHGSLKTVLFLLENGADVNIPDDWVDGKTPLQIALEKQYQEIAEAIRSKGGREYPLPDC